jgi:methyl acetate hydrolase
MNGSAIDEMLERAVGPKGLPGVAATAAIGDDVVYEGAAGERALGGGAAMTPDTVVWIASMTKEVTGAAAMQLVERGQLDLDAPAEGALPELAGARVLEGFDDAGRPKLRPPKSPITLRRLLTHTSGFGYEIWNADVARWLEATGTPDIMSCKNATLSTPLLFDPGERWEYGRGIDWAGKMVEAASGKRLGDYLRENLFEPLGMASTSFRLSPGQRERLAKVHTRGADGMLAPIELEIPQDPEFEMGGGGLYSTVRDYLRFTRTILGGGTLGGTRVLAPATVAAMSRNQIGEIDVQTLRPHIGWLSNETNFYPGMKQKWGLSFLINTEATPEGRSPGSLSWAGLSNAYYWIDPAKQTTGVLATQILPFFDGPCVEIFRAFERTVAGAR